jgi:hypothetical protein
LKRDTYQEEAKYNVDQKPSGLTRLLSERDVIVQSKLTDFEVVRVMDMIPGKTEVLEIDAPVYSGANHLSRVAVSLEIAECYSCGSHDSSFCDYCGRCSHCCEKLECQYGCDFV